MNNENKIDHIEIPCRDLEASQLFFEKVFGWEFISYGNDYILFTNGGMNGVFFRANLSFAHRDGAPLIVLYRENLKRAQRDIVEFGGSITHPVFSFPGGSRFHFADPSGNEYAVWSDVEDV